MTQFDVEAIRKRHEREHHNASIEGCGLAGFYPTAHADRAALLTLLPAESTGIAQVWVTECAACSEIWGVGAKGLPAAIEDRCCGLDSDDCPLRTKAAPATQQAGEIRRAALEEAATLCDGMALYTGLDAADAIRALSTTPPVAAADGATTRWLSIETAPRDRTPIICAQIDNVRTPPYVAFWNFTHWYTGFGDAFEARPTHWQPLSAPPAGLVTVSDGADRMKKGDR